MPTVVLPQITAFCIGTRIQTMRHTKSCVFPYPKRWHADRARDKAALTVRLCHVGYVGGHEEGVVISQLLTTRRIRHTFCHLIQKCGI